MQAAGGKRAAGGGTGGRRAVSGTLLKMLLIVIEPRKVETQSHHVARGAAVVEHLPLSFSSGRAWMYFLLVLPALCVCVCLLGIDHSRVPWPNGLFAHRLERRPIVQCLVLPGRALRHPQTAAITQRNKNNKRKYHPSWSKNRSDGSSIAGRRAGRGPSVRYGLSSTGFSAQCSDWNPF